MNGDVGCKDVERLRVCPRDEVTQLRGDGDVAARCHEALHPGAVENLAEWSVFFVSGVGGQSVAARVGRKFDASS